MNALDPFRDSAAVAPHDDGAAWTDAVQAADPSATAADVAAHPPVTQPPLPVPVPPVPAGLDAPDGTRLVAGLAWETASGPEAPVLRGNAPSVLRLPDRRARLAEADGGRCGSLLLAMAAGLARHVPGASGPWALIAEIPDPDGAPLLWLAVADIALSGDGETDARVTPRPGPEATFDDPDEALAALQEHLAITEIAGLAVRWRPVHEGMSPADTHRGHVIQGLAHIAPDVPLHDVEPDASGLPAFAPPRRVPVRLLGGLAIGTAAFLAGILVVLPTVQALFETPPPPPPEMVAVGLPPGSFAAACTSALDAWWPRVTGWRAGSAGCALSGHLPAGPDLPEPPETERLARPMTAWRHLLPGNGRNGVLARAAAEQMIGTWPHEARLAADSLTLWRTASLPLAPTETVGEGATPLLQDPDAVRSRLAARWADAPDAVSGGEQGADSGLFTVRVTGGEPAGAILSRAGGIPGIAPVRLVQSAAGEAELVLAPIVSRDVPAEFLEPAEGRHSP